MRSEILSCWITPRTVIKRSSGPRIIWRNGRAYGDFRSYSDVGGGREALAPPGRRRGTKEPDLAEKLFRTRWNELRDKRTGNVTGNSEKPRALDRLVRDYLKKAAGDGKRNRAWCGTTGAPSLTPGPAQVPNSPARRAAGRDGRESARLRRMSASPELLRLNKKGVSVSRRRVAIHVWPACPKREDREGGRGGRQGGLDSSSRGCCPRFTETVRRC
jgi:hypothetical protein